jgi:pyruvate, water dikinase
MYKYLKFFEELTINDIPSVGGKNASLGEMYHHLGPQGVNLPNGVATTADAYRYFLEQAGLNRQIAETLEGIDVSNVHDLAARGSRIRDMIVNATLPQDFQDEIVRGYRELCQKCGHNGDMVVAIRSSATAEDLPNASLQDSKRRF